MSFDYIRETYHMPWLRRGIKVSQFEGKSGTVKSAVGAYVRIKLDGEKSSRRYHPTWQMTYYDTNGNTVLRTRGDELARAIMLSPFSEAEYNRIERNLSDGDELERARRFVVRSWQAHGGTIYQVSGWKHNGLNGNVYPARLWKKIPERLMMAAERLQNAEIRCKPALDIIDYYNTPDCLLYVDPPYHLETRGRKYYSHEMTNQDHINLLETLRSHKGIIILSGYAHPLYDEMLTGWERFTTPAQTEHGNVREEVLWINRPVAHQGLLFEHDAIF